MSEHLIDFAPQQSPGKGRESLVSVLSPRREAGTSRLFRSHEAHVGRSAVSNKQSGTSPPVTLPLVARSLAQGLGGVRLLIGGNLGAQSWAEILAAFPDFTLWLWALALLVLLTGATRLALTRRALRRGPGERQSVTENRIREHHRSTARGVSSASTEEASLADDAGLTR